MTNIFLSLIKAMGEDPQREGLLKTPQRAAKAFDFLTSGYKETLVDLVNGAIFESKTNKMILIKNIEFYSLCEHHLLPFFGKCHIGYIPNNKILGLSKFARIVDMCTRQLQIQENLTSDICDAIVRVLDPLGVGILLQAKHLCMMMRGVTKQNSEMVTSEMFGIFLKDPNTRCEFMQLLKE